MLKSLILFSFLFVLVPNSFSAETSSIGEPSKKLVYLVSDLRIPFWNIMSRGISFKAEELGYEVVSYSANNNAKKELQLTVKAIQDNVAGIIVSPTNSSACVTILKLAKGAGIPVVISDIGTDAGEYVSYISSDNKKGAYEIGKLLAEEMYSLGWQDGRVGIVAIPQGRDNGKARTAGFMEALKESNIKGAGIRQQVNFSYQETYDFSKSLIEENANLRALWLQGSDKYQGALDAIRDTGKKGEVLLSTFDAEPVFLKLIPTRELVGSAMQQPFFMGEQAVTAMDAHLLGKSVIKEQKIPTLAISSKNIKQALPIIKRNVLGLDSSMKEL